jgi:hypothetical protein
VAGFLEAVVRYYDSAAYYLSQEQREASFLQLQVNIRKFRPPISESFKRNPPQTVWGYVTLCYQQAIIQEIELRYDYQTIYRDLQEYSLLAQLMCVYFDAITDNQKSIADSNTAQLPYTIRTVEGLVPTINRPLDSIRVVTIVPTVFDIIAVWTVDDEAPDPCAPVRIDTPIPADEPTGANPYDPTQNSDPSDEPESTPGADPTDPDKSAIPSGAPDGDFGPRNNTFPTCNTYFVRIDGVAANDSAPGGRVDVINYQNPCGANPPPYTLVPDDPPSGVSPITGTFFFYKLIASNGVQCNVWSAGWLEGPTVGEVTCAS